MPTIEFDPSEGVSPEQEAAEAQALAQGQKLAEMEAADKATQLNQIEASEEDASLILGKFKTVEDLQKAYKELERKQSNQDESNAETDDDDEPTEEGLQAEGDEEAEVTELSNNAAYMLELSKEYQANGKLSDEAMQKLASLDQTELINSYFEYAATLGEQIVSQQLAAEQVNQIQDSVGGSEAYGEMISWAANTLSEQEINDYNSITNGNNVAAARFAVEALSNRWKAAEGYEAPLLTGKTGSPGIKPFRSQAELARAIANPKYESDPAYRMDVENRLQRSKDLM